MNMINWVLILPFINYILCQRTLMQIQPAGVGYLINYNSLIQQCLKLPYLCNNYDSNDTICITGWTTFQNCIAQNCYPVQQYNQYSNYQKDYSTFGTFMLNCVFTCQKTALDQSKNPTQSSLVESLDTLVECYTKNENEKKTLNYYLFFFLNQWQACIDDNSSCLTDATFEKYNDKIKSYVQDCIDQVPIYITNTAFVQSISMNQTTTCIDYQNNKCFSALYDCGQFSLLQPIFSQILSLTIFGLLLLLITL